MFSRALADMQNALAMTIHRVLIEGADPFTVSASGGKMSFDRRSVKSLNGLVIGREEPHFSSIKIPDMSGVIRNSSDVIVQVFHITVA